MAVHEDSAAGSSTVLWLGHVGRKGVMNCLEGLFELLIESFLRQVFGESLLKIHLQTKLGKGRSISTMLAVTITYTE